MCLPDASCLVSWEMAQVGRNTKNLREKKKNNSFHPPLDGMKELKESLGRNATGEFNSLLGLLRWS